MNASYLQPNHNKDQLLNSNVTASVLCDPLLLLPEAGPRPKQRTLYKCEKDRHVTDSKYATCPNCSAIINYQLCVKDISALEKRVVGFGVNEALELLRTSLKSKASLSSVFLLKKEALELLRTSLKSKASLSSVFLLKKEGSGIETTHKFKVQALVKQEEEALELLRTSLKSKASLTSVFLMKNGVYEGEGRLRKAVEGRLEVLRRSMMMLMDTQERVRADMDRIVVNTVLNNKAGVQPLAAVEQNQVPTRVAIHREIIGPSNRKGPADQPAWSRSMSRPMANEPSRLKSQLEIPPYRAIKREADPPQKDRPQWFGTRNKTTVSRVEAKSHRRNDRKQSPSAKRRAVEEVQSEMKVTEQCSGIAKDFFEVKGFCD
ncbi:hypothetical protein Q3G72_029911 [Acer saccharum]|nr:hypothetical protein Q3G72_029911 [Acer saccharum]